MKNNLLNTLDVNGLDVVASHLGMINLYNLDRIYSIFVSNSFDSEQKPNLLCQTQVQFVTGYEFNGVECLLEITFENASRLRFPKIMQFTELEIKDVTSSQMEMVSFEVTDYGECGFSCLCNSISIKMV